MTLALEILAGWMLASVIACMAYAIARELGWGGPK